MMRGGPRRSGLSPPGPLGGFADRGVARRRCARHWDHKAVTAVMAMKPAVSPKIHAGWPWSRMMPKRTGPIAAPILKPVVTIPKTRPAAPGGAASRAIISREGWIRPEKKPATLKRRDDEQCRQGQDRNKQGQNRGDREADRRDGVVMHRAVGDHAPGKDTQGGGEQERRRRAIRRSERHPLASPEAPRR